MTSISVLLKTLEIILFNPNNPKFLEQHEEPKFLVYGFTPLYVFNVLGNFQTTNFQ